jgi:hypothetical protein
MGHLNGFNLPGSTAHASDDPFDWSGRAKASYRLAIEEPVYEARYHNFCEGEGFWQAALQQAERSEDAGAIMRINEEIERLRDRALRAVQAGAA